MKKRLIFPIFILLTFIVVSCSYNKSKDSEPEETTISSEAGSKDYLEKDETSKNTVEQINIDQRKVIKTGTLVYETDDLEKTRNRINNTVVRHKAYISNEQSYSDYDRVNNVLVIRVDSKYFDKLVSDICEGVEKFDTKTIDVNDVTEEFLDIQARLKTKKELEQRYIDLLKKANTVGEILEIEREIGNLRADIESIEGRLKYMSDRVDFSTLTVTFYKRTEGNKTNYAKKFVNGFFNGIKGLIWFFIGVVNIWPFILIVVLTLFFIRRYIKKKRSKKNL